MKKRPNRPKSNCQANNDTSTPLDFDALDTPERIIEFCRARGYIDGQSTDIRRLIEDTPNLRLEFKDLGEYDGSIKKVSENDYLISINSRHSATRQRFSMAHEYVHFQFHRDQIEQMPEGEKILYRSEERNRVEYQANRVAAEILMPESIFVEKAREINGDIVRLSEIFKVSTLAIRYRAKELGFRGHGF